MSELAIVKAAVNVFAVAWLLAFLSCVGHRWRRILLSVASVVLPTAAIWLFDLPPWLRSKPARAAFLGAALLAELVANESRVGRLVRFIAIVGGCIFLGGTPLLSVVVIVAVAEQVAPRNAQPFWGRQNIQNAVAALLVSLVVPFASTLAHGVVRRLHLPSLHLEDRWPLWGQALFAFVVMDFKNYWWHRMQHSTFLWEFHKLHHGTPELGALVGNRINVLEETLLHTPLYVVFLAFIGLSGDALLWGAVIMNGLINGPISHSNCDWPRARPDGAMPLFARIINTPRAHAEHHRRLVGEDDRTYNFAFGLSLWDWLFGTQRWPAGRQDDFGIDDEAFSRSSIAAQHADAIVSLARRVSAKESGGSG